MIGSDNHPWRDDLANLQVVKALNEAYDQITLAHDYEGMLGTCPVRISWDIGPDLPGPWKGGVAGMVGGKIAMVGGLWMPGRENLAYAYDTESKAYQAIPPPPFETAYTQGATWDNRLYLVGGRSAVEGQVVVLTHSERDGWRWADLPPLPDADGRGRWLSAVEIVEGRWVLVIGGIPSGKRSEETEESLSSWRLRLDTDDARWETMAPYPGDAKFLIASGVIGHEVYGFGGRCVDLALRSVAEKLRSAYHLGIAPHSGVPLHRDAFRYDPDQDEWTRLQSLPFCMCGGFGIPYRERYILLMGTSERKSHRVGQSICEERTEPRATYYDDVILCYDIARDSYYRVGAMVYGVATAPWVLVGDTIYGLGGEPAHYFNKNTENVLQIGSISL